jgi:hypothetical protein
MIGMHPLFVEFAIFAAAAIAPPASLGNADPVDLFAGRDGRAEALADLRNGKPARLYSHVNDGEGPGYATPGLFNCDPSRNNGSNAAESLFVSLPEADFAEDRRYTEAETKRAQSASRFARSYNLAIFRARRAEILRACPEAEIIP